MANKIYCIILILSCAVYVHGEWGNSFKVDESWNNVIFNGFLPPPSFGGLNPSNPTDAPKIIGGTPATPGAYPHQISLQVVQGSSRYHSCGGSILSPTKIACAAHCCSGRSAASLRVVAGAHNMQVQEPTQQVVGVARVAIHPSYNSQSMNNDACKIFLSTPLTLNARVQAIDLCTSEPTTGTCTATGWGTTSTGGNVTPSSLQQINLAIIPRSTCASQYSSVNRITASMLCAGGTAGKGGCNGDSGGPLVCTVGGVKCLAGATSWGMQPCAQQRYPTVYANTASLRSFYSSN
jgi:secreted trypsin-like serine protease